MLETHMRTDKVLILIAAIAVTALELLVFSRESGVAPQLETHPTAAARQSAPIFAPSINEPDSGFVSGE